MLNEISIGKMKQVIKIQGTMQKLVYKLTDGHEYVSKE